VATVLIILIVSLFILSNLALIWARVEKREFATVVAIIVTVVTHVTFWVAMRDETLSRGVPLVLAFAYELATIMVVCFTIAAMLQDHEYDL
jgi:hypothetical protein